jgi:hypothetical protein
MSKFDQAFAPAQEAGEMGDYWRGFHANGDI